MIITIVNTSGAVKVMPVINESVAIGATVIRGIKETDLYKGENDGNPEWKKLLDFQQRGWVTVTIVNDANASGPLPTDWFITAAHHARHENGGADEMTVLGLSGLLADAQTPLAHAASHQNGGADEITVLGLSGLLADAQTPLAHHASHENGGGDEMTVLGLSGLLADGQTPLAHRASHLPAGTDEFQTTAPTLTPAAELADVINVAFQSPVASVERYMATLMRDSTMEPSTAAFVLAETGVGAEVSPTARARLIFTTDATGAALLSCADVAGASSATCWLIVEPMFASADIASPCAPAAVSITFDAA